jgi:uncharacterized protein
MGNEVEIRHEPERGRFVAHVTDSKSEAVLRYRVADDRTLDYYSTYTPINLRGRGIAGRLVAYALDYALENGLNVIATCPFVAGIMARSPKYGRLAPRETSKP